VIKAMLHGVHGHGVTVKDKIPQAATLFRPDKLDRYCQIGDFLVSFWSSPQTPSTLKTD
jgi:hypothetical protein